MHLLPKVDVKRILMINKVGKITFNAQFFSLTVEENN